ncbi:hypothetical protein [Arthrobacter sp. B1805]|uniref:hypothetical protein n=1 Tax=Arthrobacter sp. B1805 TaxID=2058892 RepID=UPI000CE4C010|nr:hypothetical protein [Arthrobacter sp. B1805]
MAEDFTIRFRCTGRGTHASRELRFLERHVDGGATHRAYLDRISTGRKAPYTWGQYPISMPSHREGKRLGDDDWAVWNGASHNDGDNPNMWRMKCPSCRLDMQFKSEKLAGYMDGLHELGRSSVDLSRL